MSKNQHGNNFVRSCLSLCLIMVANCGGSPQRPNINLAQLSNNLPYQLPKVYHVLADNDMLQENEMADNSIEVFRLRREHKKKKQQEKAKQIKEASEKKPSKPVLRMQLQEQSSMNLGIGMNNKAQTDFVEVVSGIDSERAEKGRLEDAVKELQKKTNYSQNEELNEAAKAAIQFLVEQKDAKNNSFAQAASHPKPDWGIFTYFYHNGTVDYQRSETLEAGQQLYRNRGNQDDAKIFVANGEVTRTKGDQVGIEILTGQALMDLNLKQKTFDSEKIYVVNHENNSIYNDITKFDKNNMSEVKKEFDKYPKEDATVILRGSDAQILKKKGDEKYVAQNMAYIYNDNESQGKEHNWPFSAEQLKPEMQD